VAINDHGDVVGRLSQGDVSTTVVWSGGDYTKYRKVKGVFPIGIDNLGTVVTFDGQVITRLGISWRVRKPVADAGLRMGTYDNGVIAGWYSVPNEGTKGAVWNLDGSIKSRIDGVPYAANRRGTTVGSFDGTDFRVWRNGEVATAPDPAPAGVYQSLFLDSNDVVTGTYQGDDFDPHAAQWRCS
jgi:hypothetical protein